MVPKTHIEVCNGIINSYRFFPVQLFNFSINLI